MGGRYSKHGTGREWRRGVYRIESLPELAPGEWKHPREMWGCSVARYSGGENTSLELIRVPEGLALLAFCRFCGGRHETLVPSALADVQDDFERLLMPLHPWREQHAGCNHEAIVWRTPALVDEFVCAFLASARQDLARGVFVRPCMHLLTTDGRAYSFFPPALPQYEDEVLIETEAFRSAVRMLIRRRKLDLLAAVVTGENWFTDLRQGDLARQEGISIYYVTADYGKASLYPIRRHVSGTTSGPGELLPEAVLQGVPAGARLLDTLFM
jgi:hypothetical protein